MSAQLRVGQRVSLPNGSLAYIRYLGDTDFKEGEWVGLELDEPVGKNNGTIDGTAYFQCPEKHGMFMRPLPTIEVLEQPKPATKPAARPTSQVSKASSSGSHTPAARTRQSVAAPPPKRTSFAPSSTTSSGVAARRSTIAPQTIASRTSRLSTAGRSLSPKKPIATVPLSTGRPSLTAPRPGIRSPGQRSNPSPGIRNVLSPTSSAGDVTPRTARLTPQPAAQSSKPSVQQSKAIEELKTKVQFLEKKRMEDRDKIREIDGLKEKKAHYENIIQKLQSKYQTLHIENGELKKETKELGDRQEELERMQAENDSILELATLDREMAEERAESYLTELDALKGHMEELQLENEILREENEEFGKDISPEEKASQGWLQMQRENNRLREALLRLRDWSQEQEAQLKDEVKLLEEDTQELATLREQYDESKARILQAEADAEDLREQLDAALGAEAMIDQLTDKNLNLTEQMEDLRKTVEHLQDLKELNDELEINHIEHEKQLQEVIDFKESLVLDLNRHAFKQEEELTDKEYTILRFRDLVSALQSDLEDMRSSKEISEMESQNLENSSRAIMDLNRQLQASANSATVKAIDMELGKLEAEQASEHLSIVQLFLPDAFHSERDSVLALLRFKRIGFKAHMLHGFIKQRISGSNAEAHLGVDLYAACDALDKLTWIWAMCSRIIASMQTSPLDQFSRYENTLHELEPVERSLNGYIENLRKDELQEQAVVDSLQRSIAVMKHIAELHLREGLESYAEEILMRTLLMQSSLENTAAALVASKDEVLRTAAPADAEDDDGVLFEKTVDSVISDSRSAKVIAGKVHRALQDMKSRSLSLNPATITQFDKCSSIADDLFVFARDLGAAIKRVSNEDGRSESLVFGELLTAMRGATSTHFEVSKSDIFGPMQTRLRALIDNLSDLSIMSSDFNQMAEFEKPPPPWVLRSREVQDSKAISAVAEEEIRTLKREIQERATSLKMREQKLEEAKMKIDLLEVRMRDANKKIDQISVLEHAVEQAKERERSMEKAVESQSQLVLEMEIEKERWKRVAAEAKTLGKTGDDASRPTEMVASMKEMDALKLEVKTLQSTTRYLRQQTRRTRLEEEAKQNSWLSTPLTMSKKRDPQQQSMRAVLGNLALLPSNSQPLRLPGPQESKPKSQPLKTTPRYQLIEQEMKSLRAWDPLGLDWTATPRIVGVDAGLGRTAIF